MAQVLNVRGDEPVPLGKGQWNRFPTTVAVRAALVASVCRRFGMGVYGRGWAPLGITPRRQDVYPREHREICSGAKIVLGRDWTTDCAGYTSNRTRFTLGRGGFLLTSHSLGVEALVANHRHLVWYGSEGECLELIAHYLARPEQRRRIAENGRAFALAHRTYRHVARDLIAHIEGKTPGFPPATPELASRPVGARPAPRSDRGLNSLSDEANDVASTEPQDRLRVAIALHGFDQFVMQFSSGIS